MTQAALGTGWQQAADPLVKEQSLANAIFKVEAPGVGGGTAVFSELSGISSEVEQIEYMEAGQTGPVMGRFIGKAKPPTVTLKRSMSTGKDTEFIWMWHQMARTAGVTAYKDATLALYTPTYKEGKEPVKSYTLLNAFPTKVEIAGMKAGGTEMVTQTVTLQCDEIIEL